VAKPTIDFAFFKAKSMLLRICLWDSLNFGLRPFAVIRSETSYDCTWPEAGRRLSEDDAENRHSPAPSNHDFGRSQGRSLIASRKLHLSQRADLATLTLRLQNKTI
jgi:hypothetical protein